MNFVLIAIKLFFNASVQKRNAFFFLVKKEVTFVDCVKKIISKRDRFDDCIFVREN